MARADDVLRPHTLPDVERVCDTVAVLDRGRVVARGPIGAIEIRVKDVGAAIPAMVAARQLALSRMEPGETGLDEVFVDLVGVASGRCGPAAAIPSS